MQDVKTIILATNNEHKTEEIKRMLEGSDIEVLSLKEAGINIEIEETGETFEENALIKASEVARLTGKPALADDSGLSVDALDGAPGVYSSRFMGEDTSYSIKNKAIIEKLSNVSQKDRGAAFKCAMALVIPMGDHNEEYIAKGELRGIIAHEPMGENGFGYDPIVYIEDKKKTAAQLSADEKNSISHRGKALAKMLEIINEIKDKL